MPKCECCGTEFQSTDPEAKYCSDNCRDIQSPCKVLNFTRHDQSAFKIILEFPDQSENFSMGFEAGIVWQLMNDQIASFEKGVHEVNRELFDRMATLHGYSITQMSNWENFVQLLFTRTGPKSDTFKIPLK